MNPLVEQLLNELREFDPELANEVGHRLRRADGKSLGELLAEQTDAVLAGALRFEVFRNQIIEELLVVRHSQRLLSMFRTLGTDEHTAENLVQDLCTKVLQGAMNKFDANQEFGRYLRTMVRNLFRSARRRQCVFTEDMRDSPGPDTVDQEVEMQELLNRFEEAIRDLPEQEQTVMRLTSEGWEPRDIASELGLEVGRIYAMRAECRTYLAQELSQTLPAPTRGRPKRCIETDVPFSDDPPDQP